jgi:hypothetical protein
MVANKRGVQMRRFAMKALFAALALNKTGSKRIDWDRNLIVVSTLVTVGLVALYFFGKATSRW